MTEQHKRLYRIYCGMKQRCHNPNNVNYVRYGGRGITVCDEWLNDFKAFEKWAVSHGYTDELTIDRINSNKGYSPENCRWISLSENASRAQIGKRKKKDFSFYEEELERKKHTVTVTILLDDRDNTDRRILQQMKSLKNWGISRPEALKMLLSGKSFYPVILTPAENGYVVSIPDLQINTEGENIPDAIAMARDAIGLWGISEEDAGRSIPAASGKLPPHSEEEIATLVDIDFEAYRRANDLRTVRKNVTVPSWLNSLAENAGINFSQILQEGLKARLHVADPY